MTRASQNAGTHRHAAVWAAQFAGVRVVARTALRFAWHAIRLRSISRARWVMDYEAHEHVRDA